MKGLTVTAACALALCMTSCGDDDDDASGVEDSEEGVAAAWVVEGSYDGYTSTTFTYVTSAMITADETVTLTATDDNTVDVTYTSDTWGVFVITGAAVTQVDDGFALSGKGTATMTDHSGTSTEYVCTFAGTIDSGLSSPSFTFTLPDVMSGTVIEFISGDAPAAYVVAGTYSGTLAASFAYGSMSYDDETITVTAVTETTADVTYSNDTWGDYTVSGATVTRSDDGSYVLTGEGTATVSYHSDTATEYGCTLSATISADLTDYTFTLSMDFMSGTTLTLTAADDE